MVYSAKQAEREFAYFLPGGPAELKNRFRYPKAEGVLPQLPTGRAEGPNATRVLLADMLLVVAAPLATEGTAFNRLYRDLQLFASDEAQRLGNAETLHEALTFALTWGPLHEERRLESAEIIASWPCAIFTFRELQLQNGHPQLVKVRYGFSDASSARLHGYHTTPGRRSLVLPETVFGHFAQRLLDNFDGRSAPSRSGWVGDDTAESDDGSGQ